MSNPKNLPTITLAEYNAIPADYRSVWTTERTDWPDWDKVREQYMGKRTRLAYDANRGTCLEIEGLSFIITD